MVCVESTINLDCITFSRFMFLVHGRFAIFLYYEDDYDICVVDDDNSNDKDITKNESAKETKI
jgi:hypothetical protein